MGFNDSDPAGLRAGAASPASDPLLNLPRYAEEAGGTTVTGTAKEDDFARTGCQQSGVARGGTRGLVAPPSPAITYSYQQHGQHSPLQQQLQQMPAPPQVGGSKSRFNERRVDNGSPLLGSVTGASTGLQQQPHSPGQGGEIFLQQQHPPPLCTSSRGSPVASTASTPPLPQVHATMTGVAPTHAFVSPRGASPALKDLSGLLAAMSSNSGSTRPCSLAGSSTIAPFVAAGLPAAVNALGSTSGTVIDRQEEEGRVAPSTAAASVQALQRLVQNGGCLIPLAEPRHQSTLCAERTLKEASATEAAEVENCRAGSEKAKQLLQQAQMGKGDSAILATCSAQLERLTLSPQLERGDSSSRPQQEPTDIFLGQGRGGSHSFEEFLSQVHKLLRSSSTSSASSASTPRGFCGGHPTTTVPHTPLGTTPLAQAAAFIPENPEAAGKPNWDKSKLPDSGPAWGRDHEGDSRRAAVGGACQIANKEEEDTAPRTAALNNGSPSAPIIDFAVLQAVAASLGADLCGVPGTSPFGTPSGGEKSGVLRFLREKWIATGLSQKEVSSNMELQTILMLPELHRQAGQQPASMEESRAMEGGVTRENDFLQNALDMIDEGKSFVCKEPQQHQPEQQQLRVQQPEHQQHPTAIPTVQLSPPERRRGSPQNIFPGRTPMQRASTGRLLAPTYQTYDQIQSAPNPSTPIIRGSDKISVEQFLMSFPFTRTVDYAHAALKFCADHNLVVKLLGYHGKRVELLERQYCCRIQTSAQASSFPGYPNGRCVLFTGALTSLLRACSDLYAVVDTSSPGLRTNIEGYRVCLVVPGDFVGRLLRSNCAGLHALQEVGGRSVHIALGNLCVVMRGNYSERVLLIDGNLEGVCQVLEYTAAQLQDFLRRYAGTAGPALGSPQSLLTRYEFLDYPKRIELHLST